MTSTVQRDGAREADPRGRVRPRRRHVLGIALFAIVAALLPLDRFVVTDATLSTRISWAVLILLALCVVGGRVARPPFPLLWASGAVLIPIGGLISGVSSDVASSLQVGIQLGLLVAMAPFVIRYYVLKSGAFLWWVGAAFTLSQSYSAAIGMAQLAGATPFETKLIFGRATGLAGHPNVLGIMSVIAIFALAAALPRVNRAMRVPVLALLVLNSSSLVFSGSLSSMLAMVTGLVVVLMVKRRLMATFVTVVLGGTLVAVFAGAGGLDPLGAVSPIANRVEVVLGTADVDGGAASVSTRILTYEWAWRFISADPLVGVGMDSTNAGTYNGYTPVHNYILHAWYQGGLFFFLWTVFATVAFIRLLIQSVRCGTSAVPTGLMMAMVLFAATSAFYDQQAYWFPLLVAIACLTAPARRQVSAGRTGAPSGRGVRSRG